jgi:hypothetical protein
MSHLLILTVLMFPQPTPVEEAVVLRHYRTPISHRVYNPKTRIYVDTVVTPGWRSVHVHSEQDYERGFYFLNGRLFTYDHTDPTPHDYPIQRGKE